MLVSPLSTVIADPYTPDQTAMNATNAAVNTAAEPATDPLADAQVLLQKSLTIYEIDQELTRLNDQQDKLDTQIADNEQQIADKEHKLEATRKHAGSTLRAYYMGDRDGIWLLLFSASSFADALKLFDYLQMIVSNDQYSLTQYAASYRELQGARDTLKQSRQTLADLKDKFLTEREKLVQLQKERDEQLAMQKEDKAAELQEQSEQLVSSWKEVGLPLFKQYLDRLSQAMSQLPQLLSKDASHYLVLKGFDATFQITDTELNSFLQSVDPELKNLTFVFNDQQMAISSTEQALNISVKGHYSLEQKDAAKIILFHIDELRYKGFELPESTAKDLENQFELGFYPDSYASFLDATGLTMTKGKLIIQLKIKL
jgi:peptidoglycan hydrolase CwlO-like protein